MEVDRWRRITLGEMVNLKRGYDLPKRLRKNGPYPIVSSSGVTGAHAEAKVDPPGVVTGRYGTLGAVWYVDEPYWPLNTTLYVQDFKGNHERFIAYLLESLDLGALVSSAAVPGINRNHLHTLLVWVPDRPLQASIAASLGAFDDLIENNWRRIEILEESARLLYREWFVHFRFPGHEDVELVDSDLGLIPEGWEVNVASIALEITPKLRAKKDQEYRFITMGDLSASSMDCRPSEVRSGNSGAKFQNGDILFARITPCLENGKTGFVQCLDHGEIGRGSTEFIVLRGRRLSPEYTYLLAREDGFRQHAITSMSGASGRQRVSNACFDSYLLAVPPPAVAQRFSDLVAPMFSLVARLADQNETLREARDLLLPRLISGELDICDLDLDLSAVAV